MTASTAKKIPGGLPEEIWFVARGSVLKGPYTSAQIEEKIRKREFTYFDFCWKQGFREWRPLSAVESFDRREKVRKVPSYPQVPVPSTSGADSRTPGAQAPVLPLRRETDHRIPEIRFAKQRRHSITAYEWAAAVCFAVMFAYLASSYALNEVKQSILQRVELHDLGRPQSFGTAEHSVEASFWDPLYSAPSFADTAHLPSSADGITQTTATLPVKLRGHAQPQKANAFQMNGYAVNTDHGAPVWTAADYDLDPVYSRVVEFRGYLSPANGSVILVKHPGDPGLYGTP
ncbi:MAG: DUF4339 domain-containing protein [Bdellovibrionales bacterium]|nr:DUF4339 domain-containing protein [Bdellovibrionales bacterium]